MELSSEEKSSGSVKVNNGDTEELIRLTEALDLLSTKIERIGGIVTRLYQMTERLEISIKETSALPSKSAGLDDSVLEWINNKVAKKRRKELKKWHKKKGKKDKQKH